MGCILQVGLLLLGAGLSRGSGEEVLNPSSRIEALENLISPFKVKMKRSGSSNINSELFNSSARSVRFSSEISRSMLATVASAETFSNVNGTYLEGGT